MKAMIVIVLLFSSISYSKTLIVSDIDDTIKVSHVRDKLDLFWYSQVTTNSFRGMNYVYGAVLDEEQYNNYESGSEVIYVTNASSTLMYNSHTKFIKKNNFPDGKIFFQKSNSDVDHKYNTIKKYLEDHDFDKLIMVGDNGQEDINFYSRITEEFKDKLKIRTYIRKVYGAPTKVLPFAEGQVPFISPLEILEDLDGSGFISNQTFFPVADLIAKEIVEEPSHVSSYDPQYFPSWLNCRDMQFPIAHILTSPIIEKAYEKIQEICQ